MYVHLRSSSSDNSHDVDDVSFHGLAIISALITLMASEANWWGGSNFVLVRMLRIASMEISACAVSQ